jgi:hypothetical protein
MPFKNALLLPLLLSSGYLPAINSRGSSRQRTRVNARRTRTKFSFCCFGSFFAKSARSALAFLGGGPQPAGILVFDTPMSIRVVWECVAILATPPRYARCRRSIFGSATLAAPPVPPLLPPWQTPHQHCARSSSPVHRRDLCLYPATVYQRSAMLQAP